MLTILPETNKLFYNDLQKMAAAPSRSPRRRIAF